MTSAHERKLHLRPRPIHAPLRLAACALRFRVAPRAAIASSAVHSAVVLFSLAVAHRRISLSGHGTSVGQDDGVAADDAE